LGRFVPRHLYRRQLGKKRAIRGFRIIFVAGNVGCHFYG
jgi:hypothetical protein